MTTPRTLATSLLLAAVLLTVPCPARAARFDPDLTWRTITTEHVNLHFHQGEEQLADEFSRTVEEVWDTMVDEMAWEPRRRVELMLVDRTDSANGYASAVPYNAIVIYVTAPQEDSTLGDYEDWAETIFTHELTHVLHLDTNHGIVRVARAVVGRVASTNEVSPWWIVEGLATFEETRHTTAGRGRSPMADMIKRTAVIEDAFPPLGNMDGVQPDPPSGNLRYLFGQDFISYVAASQGEDVWTRWTHTYGSSVPFLLPSKKVFGKRLVPLYFDWKAHLEEAYGAQIAEVEREGVREGRLASVPDASCGAPSFSPDGEKLVWSCYDLRTGSAIWMADGWGYAPEVLLQDRGAKNFTWRSDSEAFVYAGSHIVNRFNTWSDVYLYTLGTEKPSALTQGKRARDPDFSPDGAHLVVVTNKVQDNQLEVMTVDRRMDALTDVSDHTQFATPRYSPDGEVLAVSVWADGRRDLWLYSTEGEPLRQLTLDAAVDRDPEWSTDGRWLYFSSDRSGIPNIYAIDVDAEHLWQVTNTRTGATKPSASPDGKLLAYQQYSHDGWEVRILDLDPASFLDRGLLPHPLSYGTPMRELTQAVELPVEVDDATADAWEGLPQKDGKGAVLPVSLGLFDRQDPGEQTDTFEDVEGLDIFGEEQDYPFAIPPHRYNPLPTLAPTFWLPYFQTTPYKPRRFGVSIPTRGGSSELALPAVVLTAVTGASDMLKFHGWSADLSYRNDADYVGGSVGYTFNRYLPVYSISFTRRAVPFAQFVYDPWQFGPNGEPALTNTLSSDCEDETGSPSCGLPYWESRHNLSVSVAYPYRTRTTVFASYSLTFRDELRPIAPDVYYDRIPVRGNIGRIAGGWRYAWSEPTAYAISLEDARIFSLVGSLHHPWLGTAIRDEWGETHPLTQVQLTSELREYVVNPWVPNHVLAFRLAGGATLGPAEFLGTYQLGGNFGDNAFVATPDEFRMVRGYDLGSSVGNMYWLTGAEYRLPLWRVERGVGTVPAYVRTLSGLVFVDAGNAFDTVDTYEDAFSGTLLSTGAELRLSTILLWNLGVTGRLGWGLPLLDRGKLAPEMPGRLFFTLGGSF